MPQVDLETLVSACAGGSSCDRKIACETLADHDDPSCEADQPQRNPDSPPEAIWLSRDEEYDWWDRNAVYERKESTKGNSNSTNLNPNPNSNSQRFSSSFASKASIIGLPKPQKTSLYVDAKNRRSHKPGNVRLFPKRSASVGKSESAVIEPSSPKVSCMGRVKSKRDRNRRFRNRQRPSSETAAAQEKPAWSGRRKYGFLERFRAIFRSNRKDNPVQKSDLKQVDLSPRSESKNTESRDKTASGQEASLAEGIPRKSASESEPPGLGGMMRFASGRRSESWGLGGSEIHATYDWPR
ncbi:uncharacterized protein LOC114738486 [Neltuma alba]|uniref:uncharacterized protein LOC114738486 n=1 Tax=Neltuma alba TaxID=207710 RepID=UPI0010A3C210|nr:uncharacterized protein LOC114738486 [Prosopis alba]XP_028782379.1 uncharacterized protein LOC114738486 [Prosopis alba]